MTLEEAIKYIKEVVCKNRKNKEKNTIVIPNSFISSTDCAEKYEQVAKWLEELESYKDIGTPKELKELKENGAFTGLELAKLAIMQKELKKYKDLEEQGLLVRFPCPIGTTVWDIYGMGIRKNVVSGIEYGKDGRWFLWANEDEWLGELNVVVFLTREEAENKLEELKNEI
nr:MAG TPA: Z DNA-binding protein [Caudoviricetes sp.]